MSLPAHSCTLERAGIQCSPRRLWGASRVPGRLLGRVFGLALAEVGSGFLPVRSSQEDCRAQQKPRRKTQKPYVPGQSCHPILLARPLTRQGSRPQASTPIARPKQSSITMPSQSRARTASSSGGGLMVSRQLCGVVGVLPGATVYHGA